MKEMNRFVATGPRTTAIEYSLRAQQDLIATRQAAERSTEMAHVAMLKAEGAPIVPRPSSWPT